MASQPTTEVSLDLILRGICERLQISQTQHDLAEERYHAVGKWLDAEEVPRLLKTQVYAQGSFRIGTTVKPVQRNEYDLDLVCEFNLQKDTIENPVILLNLIEARLRQNALYADKLERKNRCIRIIYANEFHLDILPACPDPQTGPECVVVPDREAREWKASNPKGYAAWFLSRDTRPSVFGLARVEPLPDQETVDEKGILKRVVQLLKRWRDLRYCKDPDNAPISIVLTTLAAQHFVYQNSEAAALTAVLDGVLASIPPFGRLVVRNPMNGKEDLSERWDDAAVYSAFVSGVRNLHTQWHALVQRKGIPNITAALEALFGEQPTRVVAEEIGQRIQRARSSGVLGVQKQTGTLTVATAPAATITPVRPHTFHGK